MVTVIGQFGHCNQELINLLLTGRATSNLWETVSRLVTGTPLDDILKPPVPNVDFSSVAWSPRSESSSIDRLRGGARGLTGLLLISASASDSARPRSDSEVARQLQAECDNELNQSYSFASVPVTPERQRGTNINVRPRSDSEVARELQAQWNAEEGFGGSGTSTPLPLFSPSPPPHRSGPTVSSSPVSGFHRHDSLADENAEPFTLYHYNGLDGKANSSHLSEIRLYRRLVTVFIHVSAHRQSTYSTRSKCGGTDICLVYTNLYYTLSMQRTALNCIGVASVPLSGEGVGGIGRVPLEE
eukprot:gene653-722_t